MSNIEKMEIEAFNEAMEHGGMTREELIADNADLQKQVELQRQQYIKLEDCFSKKRDEWKKYRMEMMNENDTLRDQVLLLDNKLKMLDVLKAKERSRLVATVPKLVIIAAACLGLCCIPWTLQKLSIIGPQFGYALQTVFMMAISWCYALIWDRTRK